MKTIDDKRHVPVLLWAVFAFVCFVLSFVLTGNGFEFENEGQLFNIQLSHVLLWTTGISILYSFYYRLSHTMVALVLSIFHFLSSLLFFYYVLALFYPSLQVPYTYGYFHSWPETWWSTIWRLFLVSQAWWLLHQLWLFLVAHRVIVLPSRKH